MPAFVHEVECALDEDCSCAGACSFCAGAGQVDAESDEARACESCGGSGYEVAQ